WRRIRTTDTRIFNPLLYQLSYPGVALRRERRLYRRARTGCPDANSLNSTIFFIIVRLFSRNGVAAAEPALQIDVGATLGAEGLVGGDRFGATANGALGHASALLDLEHARRGVGDDVGARTQVRHPRRQDRR